LWLACPTTAKATIIPCVDVEARATQAPLPSAIRSPRDEDADRQSDERPVPRGCHRPPDRTGLAAGGRQDCPADRPAGRPKHSYFVARYYEPQGQRRAEYGFLSEA